MRKATENIALTSDKYAKPVTGKVDIATKEIIAETRISYDTLEANIEGQNLKNTIISMIQSRAALDLEELILQGDINSADEYLAVLDGVLKKANGHIVDAGGRQPNLNDFTSLISAVPSKYIRDINAWKMYTSRNVDLSWKNAIAARNTVAGDRFLLQNSPATALGFNINPIAMMPETGTTADKTLTTGAAAGNTVSAIVLSGAGVSEVPGSYIGLDLVIGAETRKIVDYVLTDGKHIATVQYPFSVVPDTAACTVKGRSGLGSVLLTDPQNIIVAFTRKIQMEMDKDISARQIIIVTTMKVDVAIEEKDAVGKLINVNPALLF